MRPAPPLAAQCPPSRAWRGACALTGAAAGLAVAAWLAGHMEWSSAARLAALACAGSCGAVLGRAAAGRQVTVWVRWDGERWWVDGAAGALQVRMDLGRWLLLLQHRPADGRASRWLAVSFPRGADDMTLLRTALYSPPPEPPPGALHVRAADRASD